MTHEHAGEMEAEAGELLDWDMVMEEPPPRRKGTIYVRFRYRDAESR